MYIRFIILLLQISLFQKPFYTNRRLLITIINRVFWRCVQIKSEKIKLQIYVLFLVVSYFILKSYRMGN